MTSSIGRPLPSHASRNADSRFLKKVRVSRLTLGCWHQNQCGRRTRFARRIHKPLSDIGVCVCWLRAVWHYSLRNEGDRESRWPAKNAPNDLKGCQIDCSCGGLGRNRTTDTRIFRTDGSQNVNVYSACSPKLCYVLHSVLQQKQRILSIS